MEPAAQLPGAYDPAACGAQCHRCLLRTMREGDPVPGELRPVAVAGVAIVGGSPDEQDVALGRPLIGASGGELQRALDACRISRAEVTMHLALACRAPANNLKKIETLTAKLNRAAAANGEPAPWLPPVEACRPRLLAELANREQVILLGNAAMASVLRPDHDKDLPALDKVAGNVLTEMCHDGVVRRVVPAMHPGRVMKQPRWRMPFRVAIARAFRWFRGTLLWEDPKIVTAPPAAWLRDSFVPWCLAQQLLWYDTETTALEATLARLRTVQIGNESFVVVIPLESLEGRDYYPAPEDRAVVVACLATILQRCNLVGHNAGSYDRQVIEANLGFTPRLVLDTVILARYVDPDLPNSLGFVGSYYTDVHSWKLDGKNPTTDAQYWLYGGLDVAVNARVTWAMLQRYESQVKAVAAAPADMQPIGAEVPLSPAIAPVMLRDRVINLDHQLQSACVDMHKLGVRVNQEKRERHEQRLDREVAEWAGKVQGLLQEAGVKLPAGLADDGTPLFNPNSTVHMKRLLFEEWELAFPAHLPKTAEHTLSGERATGDMLLRAYMADLALSPEQHAIIHAMRRYKKKSKMRSFIRKLRPWTPATPLEDLAVWPDGRLRVNYAVHTTGVGRLSSGGRPSRYNFQTNPGEIKDIFEPEEGHYFVGADLAAIHLVIIANRWRIPSLIDDFRAGRDPHATLAKIIFEDFDSQPGHPSEANNFEWSGTAAKSRNVSKSLRYAGAYGAAVPTIHATMTRREDDNGNLTLRTLTVADVRTYYERWMGREPEWKRAWDAEILRYKRNGFLLSPILGRRGDFTDGMESDIRNALINYPIISAEGDIMGPATVRVNNRIPRHGWGLNCGLITQIHDQLVVEVPQHRAAEAKAILEEEMNQRYPGWEIPIKADGKVGTDLKFKHDPTRVANATL